MTEWGRIIWEIEWYGPSGTVTTMILLLRYQVLCGTITILIRLHRFMKYLNVIFRSVKKWLTNPDLISIHVGLHVEIRLRVMGRHKISMALSMLNKALGALRTGSDWLISTGEYKTRLSSAIVHAQKSTAQKSKLQEHRVRSYCDHTFQTLFGRQRLSHRGCSTSKSQ